MSLNKSEMVTIGGIEQHILVRGHSKENPIILILHGGPGAPLSPIASKFPEKIEENFVVAHWDQRGAGKSYSTKIPKESMNVEQFISDTLEVTDFLINKYSKDRIYLLGLSWGSLLGINAVHRHPEKYHGYIGSGQIVSAEEGAKVAYDFMLNEVKKQNHSEALKELVEIGRPPHKDDDDFMIQLKWVRMLGFGERNTSKLFEECCSDEEINRIVQGVNFTNVQLMEELNELDIRHIKEIKVPIYFCMGKDDYQTPSILVERFYNDLKAQKKDFIQFENSAHGPSFDEPDKFVDVLLDVLNKNAI